MNWITRLLISNWNLILVPIVLLGVWLSGVWVGEERTQRAWDVERHQVTLAQARAEQKSADIKRSQEQINHEISIEFNQRSARLAADWQPGGFDRLRGNPAESVEHLSPVPATSRGLAQGATDPVFITTGGEGEVSCGQLAEDAAQTTLILLAIQRWYELHSKNQ
jgi:hypothetical protein